LPFAESFFRQAGAMSLTRLSAFCSRCSNIWSRSISLSAVVDPVKRGRGRPRKVEPVSLSEEEEKPARRTRTPKAVAEETDTPNTRRTSRSKTSGDKVADNPLHGPLGLDGLLKHPAAHSAPLTNTPKWTFDGDVDPKVYLPPPSEWENTVWARAYKKLALRDRVFLKNPVSAYQLAQAFVPEGLRDQVIIEAFPGTLDRPFLFPALTIVPGPGALTRALLQLPKERIRKIIVLEDWPEFLAYLRVCGQSFIPSMAHFTNPAFTNGGLSCPRRPTEGILLEYIPGNRRPRSSGRRPQVIMGQW